MNYGKAGGLLYATYDSSHTTCAQDYCVFGEDPFGNNFCCETAPGSLTAMEFFGGPGTDEIQLHYPSTTLDDYGAGGQGFFVTVHGLLDADAISGSTSTTSAFHETLYGDAGDDLMNDYGGLGFIYGGAGNDDITATGSFSGTIYGEAEDDDILCGASGCIAYGGPGKDVLQGGTGVDELHGGPGNDVLSGGDGDDALYGESENDDLHGGDGADKLYGGVDDDNVCGDGDPDELYGQVGDDLLYDDVLGDVLDGGPDTDTCWDADTTRTSCTLTAMSYPCSYTPR